jgi:hypothetical protein
MRREIFLLGQRPVAPGQARNQIFELRVIVVGNFITHLLVSFSLQSGVFVSRCKFFCKFVTH